MAAEVENAKVRVERRRTSLPPIEYPPELPVSEARAELSAAIDTHQVVVVAGEVEVRYRPIIDPDDPDADPDRDQLQRNW